MDTVIPRMFYMSQGDKRPIYFGCRFVPLRIVKAAEKRASRRASPAGAAIRDEPFASPGIYRLASAAHLAQFVAVAPGGGPYCW